MSLKSVKIFGIPAGVNDPLDKILRVNKRQRQIVIFLYL